MLTTAFIVIVLLVAVAAILGLQAWLVRVRRKKRIEGFKTSEMEEFPRSGL